MSRGRTRLLAPATLAIALMLALTAAPAQAQVPFKDITSSGPLTSVALGDSLGCQVAYAGDSRFELFPSGNKPADCGTFVALGDTLFAPNFAAQGGSATAGLGSYTPWTPVSQTDVAGSGTAASPRKVTTVVDAAGTGLRVSQLDSYITGQESYRTDTTLTNTGGAPVSGILYRAGDCYLQESDTGYGFLDAAASAPGCSLNANNSPPARIEQWYPITAGNQYMEASFSEIWRHIATRTAFPNTTRATETIDNGAGISWALSIPPGASVTYSHYTTFSPRGVSGPPRSPVTAPALAFGPRGLLEAPSNARCVSRRYFRIKLRRKYWPIIVGVTIRMPRTTRVLRRPPWGTIVDLRGLPRGVFKVRITALASSGRTIKGTRTYRTCRGRLRGGRPPL